MMPKTIEITKCNQCDTFTGNNGVTQSSPKNNHNIMPPYTGPVPMAQWVNTAVNRLQCLLGSGLRALAGLQSRLRPPSNLRLGGPGGGLRGKRNLKGLIGSERLYMLA